MRARNYLPFPALWFNNLQYPVYLWFLFIFHPFHNMPLFLCHKYERFSIFLFTGSYTVPDSSVIQYYYSIAYSISSNSDGKRWNVVNLCLEEGRCYSIDGHFLWQAFASTSCIVSVNKAIFLHLLDSLPFNFVCIMGYGIIWVIQRMVHQKKNNEKCKKGKTEMFIICSGIGRKKINES